MLALSYAWEAAAVVCAVNRCAAEEDVAAGWDPAESVPVHGD